MWKKRDLLQMFEPPVSNSKNRPTTLASSQFGGSVVDESTGSSPWGPAQQSSQSFNQGRAYGEDGPYGEEGGIASAPIFGSGIVGKTERGQYSSFNSQGFMPSNNALSPPAVKCNSHLYSSYEGSAGRRRPSQEPTESQPKKIRKVPPGLPSSVYAAASGDDFHRDGACYPSSKAGGVYYMQEGLHPPSDPWGCAGSVVQPGYSAMHPSLHGPFNHQDRLKRQPLPPSPHGFPLHGGEVNGAHPPGFHSGSSSFGVSSHTPPVSGSESILPHRGTVPGSSGDEIGKALASIYPSDHHSGAIPPSPSTPSSSPQALSGSASQWTRSSGQATPSPHFEGIQSMQSKLEDRLDEAINVLQRHASGHGGPGLSEMQSLLSAGLGLPAAALGLASRLSGQVTSHQGDPVSLPSSGTLSHALHSPGSQSGLQREGFTGTSSNRLSGAAIKKEEKEDEENCSITDKSEDERKDMKARLRTRCPHSHYTFRFIVLPEWVVQSL